MVCYALFIDRLFVELFEHRTSPRKLALEKQAYCSYMIMLCKCISQAPLGRLQGYRYLSRGIVTAVTNIKCTNGLWYLSLIDS